MYHVTSHVSWTGSLRCTCNERLEHDLPPYTTAGEVAESARHCGQECNIQRMELRVGQRYLRVLQVSPRIKIINSKLLPYFITPKI